MQYKEAYAYGKRMLEENHISDAQWDARRLLEHICHMDRGQLIVWGEKKMEEEEEENYKEAIKERAAHRPLQYIIGSQEFMGLSFLVNEHVLIPRQDTECLVEEVLKKVQDEMAVLDMCTGSGCIILSIAHYKRNIVARASDISPDALAVARENKKRLGLDVQFIESDLFQKIEGKYDIIVSNPPYIKKEEIGELMEEVREHEPFFALDGGEDGLSFYQVIGKEARKFLKKGGWMFFEIGYDQREEVTSIMEKHGYEDISCVKDLGGQNRVVYGKYRI